jgi:murein DD-endopeptidase MepM/ murein hydrolase activator NlpD
LIHSSIRSDSPMKSPVALFLIAVMGIALAAVFWPESDDAVGAAPKVNQANCSGHGHNNFWNHGYDFVMDIGSPVLAARDGTVGVAKAGCHDGDHQCTNLVTINHADGTVALYSHLTLGGALVKAGDAVRAGQLIGRSGETGNTGGLPHLHFSVHPCGALPGLPQAGVCPSLPVNFRNTTPNPHGLLALGAYRAE